MLRMVCCLGLILSATALAFGEDKPLNEPPKGFKALFNGKDLTGWKGLVGNPKSRAAMSAEELQKAQTAADEKMAAHWKVEDGVLVFDGKGQSLCTQQDYADFELYVDFKIKEKGDSGIYLRGTPQVQIWDPANENGVGSGGLFNNKDNPSKPLVTRRSSSGPVEYVLHPHDRRSSHRQAERPTGDRRGGAGKLLGTGQADLP